MKLSELRSRQGLFKYHYMMWDEIARTNKIMRKGSTEIIREATRTIRFRELYSITGEFYKLGLFHCFLCQRYWKKDSMLLPQPNCGNRCPLWKLSGGFCGEYGPYRKWCDTGRIATSCTCAAEIRDCVLPYLTDKTKKELGI